MTMALPLPHPDLISAVGIARKPSSRVRGHRPVLDRAETCAFVVQKKAVILWDGCENKFFDIYQNIENWEKGVKRIKHV